MKVRDEVGRCGVRRGCARSMARRYAGMTRVQTLVNVGLLLVLLGLTAVEHVGACGAPPPVACSRSTNLIKARSGPLLVAALGGPVNVPVSTFISATTNASPPCPAPLVTDIVLTSTCTLPPNAPPTGITLNTPAPGLYSGNTIIVFFPPGPPRICSIVGTATTLWADGKTTVGTGDIKICFVEPSPTDPTVPRLDMELISPPERQAHPGDQRSHMVRMTNNDLIHSVTGTFTSTANQGGRLSPLTPAAPIGSGDGGGSTAAPVSGDALPIDFGDPLTAPCVVLGDPAANTTITITKPVTLAPGESRIVEIRQRSFGTCRSGSCSEALMRFDGMFSDGSIALGCTQASFMVNSLIPPDFQCPDGGMMARAIPAGPDLMMQALLPPNSLQMQLGMESTLLSPPSNLSFVGGSTQILDQGFGDNMGRIIHNYLIGPSMNTGQLTQATLHLNVQSLNPSIAATPLMAMVIPGEPTLNDSYFLLKTRWRLGGPAIPPTMDSFFDVFYTVSLDGISSGLHRSSRIPAGSVTAVLTPPSTITVNFQSLFDPAPGLPPLMDRLEVHVDAIGASAGVPPRHDNCGGAYPVMEGVQFSGDTTNAIGTTDGAPGSCTSGLFHAVWHTFVPTSSGNFRIDTCGTNYDTVLVAFTGPDCNSLVEVGCDDDSSTGTVPACTPNGLASRIETIPLNAGQMYWLRVGGFNTSTNYGPYRLLVTRLVQNGACCCGATCRIVPDALACIGPGMRFVGPGSACNALGNNRVPCCKADFNQSGLVSVQDIFDFLAAYFGGNACSDINGSGLPPTVQDIFDFLAAYFAGCP